MTQYAPLQMHSAAPVLIGIDPFQARIVAHLRWWSDGAAGREMVRLDYRTALCAAETEEAVGLLDAVISMIGDHARRPLRRHHIHCQCLAPDEALFARLVTLAGHDLHEDAAMVAGQLVIPARTQQIAILAAGLGRYMHRLKPRSKPARLH